MISLPTPENNYNVSNPEGSVGVINSYTNRKVQFNTGPVYPRKENEDKPKLSTWNVEASIDVYFNRDAYDKNKTAIATKQVTVNFTSPPTLQTLEKEVVKEIEGALIIEEPDAAQLS